MSLFGCLIDAYFWSSLGSFLTAGCPASRASRGGSAAAVGAPGSAAGGAVVRLPLPPRALDPKRRGSGYAVGVENLVSERDNPWDWFYFLGQWVESGGWVCSGLNRLSPTGVQGPPIAGVPISKGTSRLNIHVSFFWGPPPPKKRSGFLFISFKATKQTYPQKHNPT